MQLKLIKKGEKMFLESKVRQIGSSKGVIIPLRCVQLLGLKNGDLLSIDVQGPQLILTKADQGSQI